VAITEILNGSSGKRDIAYAVCSVLLCVLAPLGWIILRLVANDDRAEDEVTGPQLRDAVDNKYKRQRLVDTDVDTVKLFADQISSSMMRINLQSSRCRGVAYPAA